MFYDILPHFMVVIYDKTSMTEIAIKQRRAIPQMTINQGTQPKRVIKEKEIEGNRSKGECEVGNHTNFERVEFQLRMNSKK